MKVNDKSEINEVEMLMDIQKQVADISARLDVMSLTNEKAEKALAISKENSHLIEANSKLHDVSMAQITKMVYGVYGILIGTIGVTLVIYIIEKALG
jgi:hypothetical protein